MKSTTTTEQLTVKKPPRSLCFQFCCDSDLPESKAQMKKVITALKRFSNDQLLLKSDYHKLENSGECKKVQTLIKQYKEPIWSIDIGHRNGVDGNYRLIFYHDPENRGIAKVLSIFIDDH